jgi:hypothetical protein
MRKDFLITFRFSFLALHTRCQFTADFASSLAQILYLLEMRYCSGEMEGRVKLHLGEDSWQLLSDEALGDFANGGRLQS